MDKIANFISDVQRRDFFLTLKQFMITMLFLGILLSAGYLFLGLQNRKVLSLECNAETLGKNLGELAFIQNGYAFSNGKMQSNEFAFSGKNSIRLDNTNPFGFMFELPYLKGNEQIRASVWRYANGKNTSGGIMVASAKGFWKAGEEVIEKSDSGWEKIHFSFSPPPKCKNQSFELYCWNNGNTPIWFDDLEIEISYEEEL